MDMYHCIDTPPTEIYTTYVCPGEGHVGGRGQPPTPAHGKCVVNACKNRTSHKTKDSAICMNAIEEAHEAGNKAFISQVSN